MSDYNDDQDDFTPEQGGRVVMKPKAGTRQKFMSIVQSPFKEKIDQMLFQEGFVVPKVLDFLNEEYKAIGQPNPISLSTLYRYRDDAEAQVYPIEVLQATGEQIKTSWDVLSTMVKKAQEQLANGQPVPYETALKAITIQQKMMKEMGINEAVKIVEQSRQVFSRIVTTIAGIVTKEQMEQLVFELKQDDLIANWIVEEEMGDGENSGV